jgi:Flp pilus assembly protein TadD
LFESYRHRRVFAKGVELLRDGRFADAIGAFRRAVDLDPGDSWSHNNLAIALLKTGELEEAAAVFQRAILMKPDFAESHENRAAALTRLERWEEAAAVYRNAIARNPANPSMRENLGVLAFRTGQWREAADALQAAILLGRPSAQLYSIRASALCSMQRFEEAAEALRSAVALSPDAASLHADLANALIQRGCFEEAADALRAAIALDSGSLEHRDSLANVLAAMGRHEEAIELLQSIASLDGGSPRRHASLASALIGVGRMDEAVAAMRRTIALTPNVAELHTKLAAVLVALERWSDAANAFATAIRLDPTNPAFFKGLGAAMFQAGNWEGSASAYRHALALAPADSEASAMLATVLSKIEPSEERLVAHQDMVEEVPDDAAAHMGLGVELAKLARWQEALDSLQKASVLAPAEGGSRFLQVDPLLRLDRGPEAASVHQQALALGGDLPALPGGAAADRFEQKRHDYWTPGNLAPVVFRVERWLEQLATAASLPGPEPDRAGLLFVLDNDYGELTTLMYLVLGRELASRSTVLLPGRLIESNADALPGRTRPYASIEDVLQAVDAAKPAVVFLCSGYLFSIHELFTLEDLARLVDALLSRGCRVVTADPFLGMLSLQDPKTLVAIHIPEQCEEFDIDEMRRVKEVQDERLQSHFTRSEQIFRDCAHLYPAFCDLPLGGIATAGKTDVRNISFFNEALVCPELGPGEDEPDARPHWLFILSRTDYETQTMFEGSRFSDIVAGRLVDALAAGRHPILIAPDELVRSVASRMPTVEGVDILTFCPFKRMISLLLSAEHAFYWNIVSHSILIRLFNKRPVVLFDRGHLVRNVTAMLPRVLQWYYQGSVPEFRDHREPLTLETVTAWTAKYRSEADAIYDRFRRAPTPEAMVEALLARGVDRC